MGSGISAIERLTFEEVECFFANRTFMNREMFDGYKGDDDTINKDIALGLFKDADVYFLFDWPITKDSVTKYEEKIISKIKEINKSLKLRGLVTSSILLNDDFECDDNSIVNIENSHCFIFFVTQSYMSILQDIHDNSSACKTEFELIKPHIEKMGSVIFIVFEKTFLDKNMIETALGIDLQDAPIFDFSSLLENTSSSWDDLVDSIFLAICSIHSPVMSTYYPPFTSSYYQECAMKYETVTPSLPLSIHASLPVPKSVVATEEIAEQLVDGNVLLVSLNPEEIATLLHAIALGQYSTIFLRDQVTGKELCYPNKCDKLQFIKMLSVADYELLLNKIKEFKTFGVPTSLLLPLPEEEEDDDDNYPVNGIRYVTKKETEPPPPCYSLFPKFASDENTAFLITSKIAPGTGNSVSSTIPGSTGNNLENPVSHTTGKTYDHMSILRGHKDFVTCVTVSADKSLIFSGSVDKSILIWSTNTMLLQHTLIGHTSKITALCLHDNDKKLYSGSLDGQLLLWDVILGVLLQSVDTTPHRHTIVSIHSINFENNNNDDNDNNNNKNKDDNTNQNNNVINEQNKSSNNNKPHIMLCSKSHIDIFDTNGFINVFTMVASEDINCSYLHTNNKLLVTGSVSGTVTARSVVDSKYSESWIAHHEAIYAVSFIGHGECIKVITGSRDSTILIWDLSTKSLLTKLTGHDRAVSSLSVSANGDRILSASWDQSLRIWSTDTGKLQVILQGHYGDVVSVCMSGDESIVVSGSYDKTVRIWR